jgi:hypothetical protein
VHDPAVRSDRRTRSPVVAAVAAVWNYLPTLVGAWVVLFLLSLVDWFGLG